jgi:hypothetical protein
MNNPTTNDEIIAVIVLNLKRFLIAIILSGNFAHCLMNYRVVAIVVQRNITLGLL